MCLPKSRLLCTLCIVLAWYSLVASGNDLLNGNNRQEVVPAPSPTVFSHDSSAVPLVPWAPLRSDTAVGSAIPRQECIAPDGTSLGAMDAFKSNFEPSEQLTAPVVVMQSGSDFSSAAFVQWKLSSLDKPLAQPAIPHGPLTVALIVDRPIDFVELMLDGTPIQAPSYAVGNSLNYSLPCPALGPHWLQARYLSGNIWSVYSHPIRFEVRLPERPRIIAASDFDLDPAPLARNSRTPITTHSIKVHLANVNPGDNIVAYVDGKPVPTQCDTCVDVNGVPAQTDNQPCCRVVKVQGVVTPGVHKLSVRVVGSPGTCAITSQPSNEIAFQYYEEDIYLLRPGAGCCNPKQVSSNENTSSEELNNKFRFVSHPLAAIDNQAAMSENTRRNDTDRVANMDAATKQAWDKAAEQAAYEAAVARFRAAKTGSDEHGVRRAQESARAAQTRESHEWNKAASRISEAEANASYARAQSIVGPPSPFYFAAAAHFPIREFGLRGEMVEREGILFYEDMKFAFDQHGNYQVHFRASAPKMPATVRLQFQIQPHRNGPWYTVTLAPIEFPYPTAKGDKTKCMGSNCGEDHANCGDESYNCCGEARECICKGHSEILRRCYGEMGQDARIRRSGTARFGFGVNVPN